MNFSNKNQKKNNCKNQLKNNKKFNILKNNILLKNLILFTILTFLITTIFANNCDNINQRELLCSDLKTESLCNIAQGNCLWDGNICSNTGGDIFCNIFESKNHCQQVNQNNEDICFWFDPYLNNGVCSKNLEINQKVICSDIKTKNACDYILDDYCRWENNQCLEVSQTSFSCSTFNNRNYCEQTSNKCFWEADVGNISLKLEVLNSENIIYGKNFLLKVNFSNQNLEDISNWYLDFDYDFSKIVFNNASISPFTFSNQNIKWYFDKIKSNNSKVFLINFSIWDTQINDLEFQVYNKNKSLLFKESFDVSSNTQDYKIKISENVNSSYDLRKNFSFSWFVENTNLENKKFNFSLIYDDDFLNILEIKPTANFTQNNKLIWELNLSSNQKLDFLITANSSKQNLSEIFFKIESSNQSFKEKYFKRKVLNVFIFPYCDLTNNSVQLECSYITDSNLCSNLGCLWDNNFQKCQDVQAQDLFCKDISNSNLCKKTSNICFWTTDGKPKPAVCSQKDENIKLQCKNIKKKTICEDFENKCYWKNDNSCASLGSNIFCNELKEYETCEQTSNVCFWDGPPPAFGVETNLEFKNNEFRKFMNNTFIFNFFNVGKLDEKFNFSYNFSGCGLKFLNSSLNPNFIDENGFLYWENFTISNLYQLNLSFYANDNKECQSIFKKKIRSENYFDVYDIKIDKAIFPEVFFDNKSCVFYKNECFLKNNSFVLGSILGNNIIKWNLTLFNKDGFVSNLCEGNSQISGKVFNLNKNYIQLFENNNLNDKFYFKLFAINSYSNSNFSILENLSSDFKNPTLKNYNFDFNFENNNLKNYSNKTFLYSANFSDENLKNVGSFFLDQNDNLIFGQSFTNLKDLNIKNLNINQTWNSQIFFYDQTFLSVFIKNIRNKNNKIEKAIFIPGEFQKTFSQPFSNLGKLKSQIYLVYNFSNKKFLGLSEEINCDKNFIYNFSDKDIIESESSFKPYKIVIKKENDYNFKFINTNKKIPLYKKSSLENKLLKYEFYSGNGKFLTFAEDIVLNKNLSLEIFNLDNDFLQISNFNLQNNILNSKNSIFNISLNFVDESDFNFAFFNFSNFNLIPSENKIVNLTKKDYIWQVNFDLKDYINSLNDLETLKIPFTFCDNNLNCKNINFNITAINVLNYQTLNNCYKISNSSTNFSNIENFNLFDFNLILEINSTCLNSSLTQFDKGFKKIIGINFKNFSLINKSDFLKIKNIFEFVDINLKFDKSFNDFYVLFNKSFLNENSNIKFDKILIDVFNLPLKSKPFVFVNSKSNLENDILNFNNGFNLTLNNINSKTSFDQINSDFRTNISFNLTDLFSFRIFENSKPYINFTNLNYNFKNNIFYFNSSNITFNFQINDKISKIYQTKYFLYNLSGQNLNSTLKPVFNKSLNLENNQINFTCFDFNFKKICKLNLFNIKNKNIGISFFSSDFSNNNNTQNFTFVTDTILPKINLSYPKSNNFYNLAQTNYKIIDKNFNLTGFKIFNKTHKIYSKNFSHENILANFKESLNLNNLNSSQIGNFNFSFFARDQSKNLLTFNVTNVTFDFKNPTINFVKNSTMESKSYSLDYFYFNITSFDQLFNFLNISIYLNNQTFFNATIFNNTFYKNLTNLNEGKYDIIATAFDKANNFNKTSNYTFIIDRIGPKFKNISITPKTKSEYLEDKNLSFKVFLEDNFDQINKVILILENNKTLQKINYNTTFNNTENFFEAKVFNLTAGNYSCKFFAYDKANNVNEFFFEYQVIKSKIDLNILSLDKYNFEDEYKIEFLGCPKYLECNVFYENNFDEKFNFNLENKFLNNLDSGLYNITFSSLGNENFLNSTITKQIFINKSFNEFDFSINSKNESLIFLNQTNLSILSNLKTSSCNFFLDSVFVTKINKFNSLFNLNLNDGVYDLDGVCEKTRNYFGLTKTKRIVIDTSKPHINFDDNTFFNNFKNYSCFKNHSCFYINNNFLKGKVFLADEFLNNYNLFFDGVFQTESDYILSNNFEQTFSSYVLDFNLTNLENGIYNLSLESFDKSKNKAFLNYNKSLFVIDTKKPILNLSFSDFEKIYYKIGNFSFNYSTSDENFNYLNLEILSLNDEFNFKKNFSNLSGNFNNLTLKDGKYNISFKSFDLAKNFAHKNFILIVNSSLDNYILYSPLNHEFTNSSFINLAFDVFMKNFNSTNVTIFNSSLDQVFSKKFSNNNIRYNFYPQKEGEYKVKFEVFINDKNSEVFFVDKVIRDWTKPTVFTKGEKVYFDKDKVNFNCSGFDKFGFKKVDFLILDLNKNIIFNNSKKLFCKDCNENFIWKNANFGNFIFECKFYDNANNFNSSFINFSLSDDKNKANLINQSLNYSILLLDSNTQLKDNLFFDLFLPNKFMNSTIKWNINDTSIMQNLIGYSQGKLKNKIGKINLTANINLKFYNFTKSFQFNIANISQIYNLKNKTLNLNENLGVIKLNNSLIENFSLVNLSKDSIYYFDFNNFEKFNKYINYSKVNLNRSFTIKKTIDDKKFNINFPSNLEFKSTNFWNGILKLPTQTKIKKNDSTIYKIEIGSFTTINFSKALEIKFENLGKVLIKFENSLDNYNLTNISLCENNIISNDNECFYYQGDDVILLTKHLTDFYFFKINSSSQNSNGGSSGGGGGSSSGGGSGSSNSNYPFNKNISLNNCLNCTNYTNENLNNNLSFNQSSNNSLENNLTNNNLNNNSNLNLDAQNNKSFLTIFFNKIKKFFNYFTFIKILLIKYFWILIILSIFYIIFDLSFGIYKKEKIWIKFSLIYWILIFFNFLYKLKSLFNNLKINISFFNKFNLNSNYIISKIKKTRKDIFEEKIDKEIEKIKNLIKEK